ncbi:MAG TPA: hypothetical protein VJR05_03345 [Acidimicrobiia bacterium]|nr:hypothetical protein [Acidimicrobiia bacterium]
MDPLRAANCRDLPSYVGKELVLGVRPEAFEVSQAVPDADPDYTISVKADLVEQLGSEAYVHFLKQSPPVITPDIHELLADQGTDPASLGSDTKFTARVDPDHAPRSGEEAKLVIDTSKLHFFDKDTGQAIR